MAIGELADAPTTAPAGITADGAAPVATSPAATPTAPPAPRRGRRRRPIRRLFVVVGVLLVPVVLVAAVYVFLFAGDSPSRLTLSTPDPSAGAPSSAGEVTGTWTVGAGSVAGYRVKEKLASLPVESEAIGRTGDVVGTVVVRPDGSGSSGGGLVADSITVQVNVSTLVSDEKPRDNRIRTTGLESNLFPTASFVGTAPVALPPGAAKGEAVTVDLSGLLTVHGVSRDVTVPLQVRLNGTRGEVVGSLGFPFSDFGMTAPSIGGFVAVGPQATLEFKLFLERSS